MGFRLLVFVIFALGIDAAAAPAPKIFAVQARPYHLRHEISIGLGTLPVDNFNSYSIAGLAYAFNFTDYLAWEVVNANAARSNSTGLASYLNEQGVASDDLGIDELKSYATTNLIYTPFYTKNLMRESRIFWGDISLLVGTGVSRFEKAGNVGTVDVGGFLRFFVGHESSLKLDVRALSYSSAQVKPNLSVSLVYSMHWAPAETKPATDTEGLD